MEYQKYGISKQLILDLANDIDNISNSTIIDEIKYIVDNIKKIEEIHHTILDFFKINGNVQMPETITDSNNENVYAIIEKIKEIKEINDGDNTKSGSVNDLIEMTNSLIKIGFKTHDKDKKINNEKFKTYLDVLYTIIPDNKMQPPPIYLIGHLNEYIIKHYDEYYKEKDVDISTNNLNTLLKAQKGGDGDNKITIKSINGYVENFVYEHKEERNLRLQKHFDKYSENIEYLNKIIKENQERKKNKKKEGIFNRRSIKNKGIKKNKSIKNR